METCTSIFARGLQPAVAAAATVTPVGLTLLPGGDRQRGLGDYHPLRAVGNTFYGSDTGNGAGFGRSRSNNDPIFSPADAADRTN